MFLLSSSILGIDDILYILYKTFKRIKTTNNKVQMEMTMAVCEHYTASEARENFAEIFNKALYKGPVVITRRKEAVAVIPLELLSKLSELEAKNDIDRASKALFEYDRSGGMTLEQLKGELGLK